MQSQASSTTFGTMSDAIADLCFRHGFNHYLLTSFPIADKAGFGDNLLLTNWPDPLVQSYRKADAYRRSKLVMRMRQTIMPVFLSGVTLWQDADGRPIFEVADLFDAAIFENILAFTLHDADMNIYILALSGVRDAPAYQETSQIHYAAMQAIDSGRASSPWKSGPRERLTVREIECLRWSAAGKSSDEIAIILSISSHTVISYLKSAMRKLEAVNRMQAVARAYRYRLL
jgi:DNA-binding CsgD family transcriptional regulator